MFLPLDTRTSRALFTPLVPWKYDPMSQESVYIEALLEALRAEKLDADLVAGTINVTRGAGRTASKANLDPHDLFERLGKEADMNALRQRQLLAGYVSGVSLSLREPSNSRASSLSYEQLAGGMLSNIEIDTFSLGVEAVHGVAPWSAPFAPVDGLIQVVYLSIDRGMRPLTLDQVERWGATDDRIYSAARSMLFHRTRDVTLDPVAQHDHVRRVHHGDGYDAARSMVLTDVFFSDLDESTFHFAIPSQNHLLFTQASPGDDPAKLDELSKLASSLLADAKYPLSSNIYTIAPTSRPMQVTPLAPR